MTRGLTLATAPQLRTSLLKCVADQPRAVIVDLARLSIVDDIHLTVLSAAARHAAAWPAVPLIVSAPTRSVATALTRLGIDRSVRVARHIDEACAQALLLDLPPHVRQTWQTTAGTIAAARQLVADACTGWRLDHLSADARLVTSELVTNAVVHAGAPIQLDVNLGRRYLHIAVRDFHPQPPRLRGPDAEAAPGGRGLLLVEAVAAAWGFTPTADGKVTWASLTITASATQGRHRDPIAEAVKHR
jgi:anti-anti-sigma regulatory factor/anti-sigma regulatory factor (Ser/Thr protein kinase)